MIRLSITPFRRSPVLARTKMELLGVRTRAPYYSRVMAQQNQYIAALEKRIADLERCCQTASDKLEATADEIFNLKILTHADWSHFCERFEKAFPGFLYCLKQQHPNLSQAESRLFMLLKLRFENQRIADTLGISLESVWRARHRLSQKLRLSGAANLECFVSEFGERIGQSLF